jgi:hypothetical protein
MLTVNLFVKPYGISAAGSLCAILAVLLLDSCQEDLGLRDDFPEPFSLYGVLSPDRDTQSVRVYRLEAYPTLSLDDPHGVSFSSTDLETGELLVWRDTVLFEPNGQQDLVFWAPMKADYEHRYRVEAVRQSDGAASYVEVRIPPPVSVRFEELESDEFGEVDIDVFIEGEGIRALRPEVRYTVGFVQGPPSNTATIPITYQGFEQQTENGWLLTIDLVLDRWRVHTEYVKLLGPLALWCPQFDLIGMEVHVIVGDTLWDPPAGLFDPNLLSHHRVLSNVENGLGFVGGGYRRVEYLFPSRAAVEKACFGYVWSFG